MYSYKRFGKIFSALLLILVSVSIAILAVSCDRGVRGEGEIEFAFEVVTSEGETKEFTVKTEKEKVGEALMDAELIDGDDGPFGLYVKTVDGETHDYDTDGYYWAFYVNDDYAVAGVDMTDIKEGEVYRFVAEKG